MFRRIKTIGIIYSMYYICTNLCSPGYPDPTTGVEKGGGGLSPLMIIFPSININIIIIHDTLRVGSKNDCQNASETFSSLRESTQDS
jgi:hypothetical protein